MPEQRTMPNPSPAEWAWLAGVFEGEGYIIIQRAVRVGIGMTDRDVIHRINALFPSGTQIKVRDNVPGWKPLHIWLLTRSDLARHFLNGVSPWLGERRSARAQQALDHIARMPGTGAHHRAKTHRAKGHAYSGDNLYITPRGYRVCRTCKRETVRRIRARRQDRA